MPVLAANEWASTPQSIFQEFRAHNGTTKMKRLRSKQYTIFLRPGFFQEMAMLDPANYVGGRICAIAAEYVAAQVFLDEKHEGPFLVPSSDTSH